jgi:hypothetical protein
MRYDELEGKCERCFSLPEEVFTGEKAWMDESLDETRILESAFIRVHEFLIQEVEKRKSELEKENYSAFKTEEYKLELSRTKHIRLLEEKLDRQEAKAKWEPTPEKRSAINRTKNEILKAREEFERELRKIRNSSSIRHKIDLFQVYAGRW